MTLHDSGQAHISVLLKEVLQYLAPEKGGVFVDGTFGVGGYTRALLEALPSGRVIAFDRDPAATARAKSFEAEFGDRFTFVQGRFSQMKEHLERLSLDHVDGIVLDLGVSSPQLDEAERGFSFRRDGPLDMRMGLCALSARDVVNTFEEVEIARILYVYGEETYSRRIAKRLVGERAVRPIETTAHLADLVRGAVPPHVRHGKIDAATKTFQALRIYVNEELLELETFLASSGDLLREGGRLVVVSFHSLEDRMVKHFFRQESKDQEEETPFALPWIMPGAKVPVFKVLTKRSVTPQKEEILRNPRSRSARLRAVEKGPADLSAKGEK